MNAATIVNFKNLFLIIGISTSGLVSALFGYKTGLMACVFIMIISAAIENRALFFQQQEQKNKVQPAYDLIFRNMPCIVKVISTELDLLMINNETTHLTGIQMQGALGKKCYDVFGNNAPCPGCPTLEAIKTKQICTASDQFRTFNAMKLCINQTAMPIFNKDGSVQYILEMSVDITERKKLEQMNHHMFVETVSSLAQLIDRRDHSTGTHSKRVREIALLIGRQLKLSKADLKTLAVAAILHDIGKIGIPENILHKTSKLSPDEFFIIKSHAEIGYEALKNITQLDKIAEYVRFHHEAVDGSGYPCHLSGEKIPLISKILCVADVYEALTANRVYRQAMSNEQALTIMREGTGTKFDPKVLHAFLTCMEQGLIHTDELVPLMQRQAG